MKLCSISDYEKEAFEILPKNSSDYYRSGACGEYTLSLNKEAFKRYALYKIIENPAAYAEDVSERQTRCTVRGSLVSAPIGVAPTAMQRMAHPDGECATARAVGRFGSVFILSTISTSSIEEVAAAAPDTIKWFQLYVYKDRNLTIQFIHRIERAGFKAIVLTVDTCQFGKRYADIRNQFKLPPHLRLANFEGGHNSVVNSSSSSSALSKLNELLDDTLNWDDVKWLMSKTNLPIILKGILTGEDAKIGADLGVAGIIVSNHGARQLDTVPASIEALPGIVRAVNGKCDVYLDGGITYGTDIFKALALGAKMVFVGRPVLWGLTVNGENGVRAVLQILAEEFKEALGLSGCTSVKDIRPGMVVHESFYCHI